MKRETSVFVEAQPGRLDLVVPTTRARRRVDIYHLGVVGLLASAVIARLIFGEDALILFHLFVVLPAALYIFRRSRRELFRAPWLRAALTVHEVHIGKLVVHRLVVTSGEDPYTVRVYARRRKVLGAINLAGQAPSLFGY